MAFVRLEQLYPLPEKQLDALVEKYGKDCNYIWLQEEPANMGAWTYMLSTYRKVQLELISRNASGSPAAGSPRIHEMRYKQMMDQLFKFAKEKA